jgi:tRNA-specific 2-thiouridylase
MSQTVYVGLSGGVDSSVAAALLIQKNYKVVGVFMKNWSRDVGGVKCPWKEDLASARSVAAHLDIELKVYDFEEQYFAAVAQYMIDAYRKGLTPNPDIMCNAEIKFKVFAEQCFAEGADHIATGHYARVGQHNDKVVLRRAVDANKDQTYFLYRAPAKNLARTLFPLGDMHKSEVRKLAEELGLPTAHRPDSQGLCFVGNIPMRTFLGEFIGPKQGDIIDQDGNVIGQHDGAFFYTIGQRQGLGVGGGKPYYVYAIDVVKNEVHVTTEPTSNVLNTAEFTIVDCVWFSTPIEGKSYDVQVRYRTPAKPGKLIEHKQDCSIKLDQPERAITPGQSAVLYDGGVVVGGGIIA